MERQRRGFAFELAERRRRPIFARRLHEKDHRALERRWRKSAAGSRAPFGHPCLHPRRDLGFQHPTHPAPRAPRIALEQHGQNDLVARPPNVVGRILGRLHEEESPEPAGREAHVADSILGTGLLAALEQGSPSASRAPIAIARAQGSRRELGCCRSRARSRCRTGRSVLDAERPSPARARSAASPAPSNARSPARATRAPYCCCVVVFAAT